MVWHGNSRGCSADCVVVVALGELTGSFFCTDGSGHGCAAGAGSKVSAAVVLVSIVLMDFNSSDLIVWKSLLVLIISGKTMFASVGNKLEVILLPDAGTSVMISRKVSSIAVLQADFLVTIRP
jgi:hypothetical protein